MNHREENSTTAEPETKASPALSYEQQKEKAKIIRKAERAVKDFEQQIAQTEQKIKDIETRMATPEGAADMELITQHTELSRRLDTLTEEWMEASEELERIQSAKA